MKISIRDFAPIKEADIALDGLTVIAGDNDTGKTTVGKLAYVFVAAAKEARSKSNPSPMIFPRIFWNVFGRYNRSGSISMGGQTATIASPTMESGRPSSISLDRVFSGALQDVLFLETPLVWQLFDTFQGIANEQAKAQSLDDQLRISVPYTYFDAYKSLAGSAPPRESDVADQLEMIEKIIDGKIVFQNNSPVFQRGDDSFPMESVATGIQSFGFIQRILELGLARPGFLLILDEPEVHLHPKWQLEYAKLLVNMVKEYGMQVLLTTHSAVFVETLEFVGKEKLGEKCKFYLSERTADDSVVMRDVSEDLEPVYEKLVHPLLQLALLQGKA